MVRYIINRIIYLLPVLFFMSVVVFLFIHLIPGDPVDVILGIEATEEARAALRTELGLDRSLLVQYISWVGNTFPKSAICEFYRRYGAANITWMSNLDPNPHSFSPEMIEMIGR